MNIEITDQACRWFEEELGVQKGDYVQLYARYGGFGKFQAGFSLGIAVNDPEDIAISTKKKGVTYYIDKKDAWYLNDQNIKIAVNEKSQEIEFYHNE